VLRSVEPITMIETAFFVTAIFFPSFYAYFTVRRLERFAAEQLAQAIAQRQHLGQFLDSNYPLNSIVMHSAIAHQDGHRKYRKIDRSTHRSSTGNFHDFG
jgi:hypothetical protein